MKLTIQRGERDVLRRGGGEGYGWEVCKDRREGGKEDVERGGREAGMGS